MTERSVLVRLRADVSDFNRKMAEAGAASKGLVSRLDAADGRMANLVQTGLALGPALVPIGAAVIPAISGLTAALGFAAVGAGVTYLAFQGVGKGLDALNAYQLEPTQANFEKLQQTMKALGPAGQEFVFFLQDLRPQLQGLQDIAQANMLPGVEEGIGALMTRLPQVEEIVARVSDTVGQLFADAGNNLADPRWTKFFDYLRDEASPALRDMGVATGNIFEGITNMVMAFDPLNDDFFNTIVRASGVFKDWSANLEGSASFTHFLDYVQTVGPEVWQTLGDVADAILSIVAASAPVGAITLHIIDALAKGISALADSSVGPGIIAVASAIGILGRSLMLLETVGLRGENKDGSFLQKRFVNPSKGVVSSLREMSAATKEFSVAEREAALAHARYAGALRAEATVQTVMPNANSSKTIKKYFDDLYAANDKQASAAKRVATAEADKSKALREGLGAAGKAAGVAAGLAVATTGLADQFELSHTASLALMGTMGGPLVAALGGAIGITMDLAGANNDLESAIRSANRAAGGTSVSFTQQQGALKGLREASDGYTESLRGWSLGANVRRVSDLFTNSMNEGREATHKQTVELLALRQGAAEVFASLNKGSLEMVTASNESVDAFVSHITPALDRAGISVRDFLRSASGSDLRLEGLDAIQSYFDNFDSAAGRSHAVADAIADMGGEMTDAATEADTLKAALDNLLSPGMGLSEATDKQTQSLKDLRAALKATKGDLLSNSDAALKAREATRQYVTDTEARAVAEARASHSGARVAAVLLEGREALIRQGRAAGIARGDMQKYLNTLGLTPKSLITVIKQPGILDAKQQAIALGRLYGLTPKEVRTLISQPGMHNSKAEIDALARKYHMTPKEVRTLLNAVDHASAVINAALTRLRDFDGRTATSYIRTVTTHQVVNIPGITKPRGPQFAGGVYPEHFDAGDVRNAHPPMIAKGSNNWRVWAEEETKGESYIPHANDWRRPRAIAIWEETGRILGQQVQRYAAGSAVRAAVPASNFVVSAGGDRGPMQVVGTLATPWGPAQIRGIAQQEAAAAVDGAKRQDSMNRRARGGK